jgi:hypothetical protein
MRPRGSLLPVETVQPSKESRPQHDDIGFLTRGLEVVCLVGAVGLIAWHLVRFCDNADLLVWWVPLAVLAALLLADFLSGVIHWSADTWGNEEMPILGRRFLRPFRVHHVNPDDFLRRDFIDCNGDVAMLVLPYLLGALLIPLRTDFGRLAAVLLVAYSAGALPTNQVHQWAHMTNPPGPVRWLQRSGLLLSREQHQRHHMAPFALNYCITTGWCNRILTAIGFFPALERIIARLTGMKPRQDDLGFAGASAPSAAGMTEVTMEKG